MMNKQKGKTADTKANPSLDFEILHVGICDAVICTRLSIDEATKRLNAHHPTGIHSHWSFDEKKSNKCPCPDGQGKTHYHLFC
jgi:hypothetical protein